MLYLAALTLHLALTLAIYNPSFNPSMRCSPSLGPSFTSTFAESLAPVCLSSQVPYVHFVTDYRKTRIVVPYLVLYRTSLVAVMIDNYSCREGTDCIVQQAPRAQLDFLEMSTIKFASLTSLNILQISPTTRYQNPML